MNISNKSGNWTETHFNQAFSRTQIGRDGSCSITNYDVTETLGKGRFGVVKLLNPRENRKRKVVKYSNVSMKLEYEISLKWPNKSIGLLIRPKAYFPSTESGKPDAIVVHKYDGKFTDCYRQLNSKQKLEAVCQLSQGLATLHDLHILHHDLYFDNILYDKRLNRYDLADFGIATLEDTNFEKSSLEETENFIQLIDKIIFDDATLDSLEIKNLLANIFGEKVVSKVEHENMRYNILREQGYSAKCSQLIIDFFAHPPTNVKDIKTFFNSIQSEYFSE